VDRASGAAEGAGDPRHPRNIGGAARPAQKGNHPRHDNWGLYRTLGPQDIDEQLSYRGHQERDW